MTEQKFEKVWKCSVEYDDEVKDFVIKLPDDMLASAGWEPGTDVEWTENDDGSYSLTEVDKDGTK